MKGTEFSHLRADQLPTEVRVNTLVIELQVNKGMTHLGGVDPSKHQPKSRSHRSSFGKRYIVEIRQRLRRGYSRLDTTSQLDGIASEKNVAEQNWTCTIIVSAFKA